MADEGSNSGDNGPQSSYDPWTDSGPRAQSADQGSKSPAAAQGGADWEKDLLNRLAFASLNEQRRSRRWNVFFKSLLFLYLFLLLMLYLPREGAELAVGKHTAVVRIEGVIAADSFASADNIVSGLRKAFENDDTEGVILRINSPGGSPVQAGYVYDEINRLRKKYPDTPIYAVVTDLCASAAYYMAAATDRIYANKASMVGSIGVLMDGFGFTGTMEKLGVQRRLMTAGEHKGFLDPFSPVDPVGKKHMQGILDNVHQQFIQAVKDGRGDRLADDPQLFSGLVWSGDQGQELGLVDEMGSTSQVARDVIKAEKIVDYTPRRGLLDRFAERVGATMANTLLQAGIAPGLR